MALIKCLECGCDFSSKASCCPKCGNTELPKECPECKKIMKSSLSSCPECGCEMTGAANPQPSPRLVGNNLPAGHNLPAGYDLESMRKGMTVTSIILGVGGIIAGLVLFVAAIKMIDIKSVAGNSINEAFYNGMGWLALGMAVAVPPVMWALGFLVWDTSRRLR